MAHFNEILCPACDEVITEADLEISLVCPHCKTNLRSSKYIDFLEYLVAQGIVDNVDFFDTALYGEDFMKYETSELDEQDITETENPKDPTGLRSGNMMSIEEEYVKDLNDDDPEDDFTIFTPSDMEDMDVDISAADEDYDD